MLVVLGLCTRLCVGLWTDMGASTPWAEGWYGSPPGHPQLLASLIFDVFNNNDVSSPISTRVIATAKLPRVSPLAHSNLAWPGILIPFSAYDSVVGSQQPYWWLVWLSRPAATDKQHDLIRFSASRKTKFIMDLCGKFHA